MAHKAIDAFRELLVLKCPYFVCTRAGAFGFGGGGPGGEGGRGGGGVGGEGRGGTGGSGGSGGALQDPSKVYDNAAEHVAPGLHSPRRTNEASEGDV